MQGTKDTEYSVQIRYKIEAEGWNLRILNKLHMKETEYIDRTQARHRTSGTGNMKAKAWISDKGSCSRSKIH